jgi:hypothetical protein
MTGGIQDEFDQGEVHTVDYNGGDPLLRACAGDGRA